MGDYVLRIVILRERPRLFEFAGRVSLERVYSFLLRLVGVATTATGTSEHSLSAFASVPGG